MKKKARDPKAIRHQTELAIHLGEEWKIRHNGNIDYRRSRAGKKSLPKFGTIRSLKPLNNSSLLTDSHGCRYQYDHKGTILKVGFGV